VEQLAGGLIVSLQDKVVILEHNVETGEVIEIITDEQKLNRALSAELLEQQAKGRVAKATAEAKLTALGLTADDLKALGLGNN
jgi:hypothetical protein